MRSRRAPSRRPTAGRRGPGRPTPILSRSNSCDPRCWASERRPLCPASPPPARACSRPGSRSTSSCTTSSALRRDLVEPRGRADRRARVVHVRLRLQQRELAGRRGAPRPASRENFERHEPPCRRASSSSTSQPTLWRVRSYSRPGIAEPRDEQVERRGALAPTEEAHGPNPRSSLARRSRRALRPRPRLRPRDGLALGTLFALGNLALGQLALFELLALDLFRLGLDEPRRHRHRREHRLLRVVQVRDALGRRVEVDEAQRVADRHPADVELEVLRNLHRQGLDGDLAADLREHAALGDADRLADQLHDDLRLDRLVEPHLLKVDVDDPAAHRMLLVLLEDRGVRRSSGPRASTSRIACSPPAPVRTRRSSRSGTKIGCGSLPRP